VTGQPDPDLDRRATPRAIPVAAFVSPHGFGHAGRACAVMQALHDLEPRTRFEIFTLVPEWFFADSLRCRFSYHPLRTDVGLVQKTPLVEDPGGTLRHLEDFLPFEPGLVASLARILEALDCRIVLSDISPLGIAVARSAGLRSVLVENFTWDWIYEPYSAALPAFSKVIADLSAIFETATLHIQTEPVCRPDERYPRVPPVSRAPRTAPHPARAHLGVPPDVPIVLMTMGGVPWRHASLRRLEETRGTVFVVPGAAERPERRGSLLALPHRSGFFHPDLVNAVDAVVGKLGYSTVAEVYAAGVPFAFTQRETFRESDALAAFARDHMPCLALSAEELAESTWVDRVPELLGMPRSSGARENGAAAAAALLRDALLNA
jgi:hypothetical protein